MKKKYYYYLFALICFFPKIGLTADPISVITTPSPLTPSTYTNQTLKGSYQFTNNAAATTLVIEKNFSDPKLFTFNDQCSNKILNKGDACTVDLSFASANEGSASVTLIERYNNNTVPLAPWTISVSKAPPANINGHIKTELPTTTSIRNSYPVVFEFKNNSVTPANNVQITKNFPAEFKEDTSTQPCPTAGETLAAQASCIIQGNLTPNSGGDKKVAVSLTYQEGAVPLTTSTTAVSVPVTGLWNEKLADYTSSSQTYPLKMSFKNESPTQNATQLNISIDNAAFKKDDDKSTCPENGTSLAAQASCFIQGSFTPTRAGNHAITATFNYLEEDQPISLMTNTLVDNTLIIATGDNNILARSTDGRYWQNITPPSTLAKDTRLLNATWSNELSQFVVVGTQGSILTSTDGETWEKQTSPITDKELMAVTWSGELHQYVIVGETGSVLTSADGKQWQSQPTHVNTELLAVIWNSELNQFVAVGQNKTILTSSNGSTWKIITDMIPLGDYLDITWDKQNKIYLVTSSAGAILSSYNGIAWNSVTLPTPGSEVDVPQWKITRSDALAMSIVVGNNGEIITSTDNNEWNLVKTVDSPLHKVIWDQAIKSFITVGEQAERAAIWISTDGQAWLAQQTTIQSSLRGVVTRTDAQ